MRLTRHDSVTSGWRTVLRLAVKFRRVVLAATHLVLVTLAYASAYDYPDFFETFQDTIRSTVASIRIVQVGRHTGRPGFRLLREAPTKRTACLRLPPKPDAPEARRQTGCV